MKFSDLGLHPLVQAGVESQNYVDCTPIQEAAIPHILKGCDIAGLAQTGTGKTAAFLVPLMDRVLRSIELAKALQKAQGNGVTAEAPAAAETQTAPSPEKSDSLEGPDADAQGNGASAVEPATSSEASEGLAAARPIFENWRGRHFVLVLVPTRELAEQVSENARKLAEKTDLKVAAIYGGASYEAQKSALKKGVQFVVATPGRLIDLFKEHLIDLNQVRAVVFDEADRMFDMGFKDDMVFILRRIPKDRQFLVFSATLNFDVLNTAYEFGANPVEVNVSRDQAKAENVKDEILHVGQADKPQFLLSLLAKHKPRQTIVFSNFKHNVERIAKFLSTNGFPAMAISSLLTQNQRNRVMELFKSAENEKNVLVATDLAARGLDIKGVDLVVNFELPDDPENYVHRIGRTGRAGAEGFAVSLVSDRDVEALQRIENYLDHKITVGWIEDEELVKEFKPFPSEEKRPKFARDGRESRDGRFEKRREQGPRRDRGPRRERPERSRPDGSGEHTQRREHQGRGDQGARRFDSRRPHGRRDQQGQSHGKRNRPQGARPSQRPGMKAPRFQHTHRPQVTAQMGLAERVGRFFKSLFGVKSAKSDSGANPNPKSK